MLGQCYAAALVRSGLRSTCCSARPTRAFRSSRPRPSRSRTSTGAACRYAFNRKESKDHGEGGNLVGASLRGRVVIVDDVITAGTAIRESIDLIRSSGAQPVAVALALDRQERGQGVRSAVQEMEAEHGLRCVSVVTLAELIEALCVPEQGAGTHFCGAGHSPAGLSGALRSQLRLAAPSAVRQNMAIACWWNRRSVMRAWTTLSRRWLLLCMDRHERYWPQSSKTPVAYRWVDENGVVHYGDSVPPQYASGRAHSSTARASWSGHTEAQKTPEQMAEEERKQQELHAPEAARRLPAHHLHVREGHRAAAR